MSDEALIRFVLDRVQEDGMVAALAQQPWPEASDLARKLRVSSADATHIARWTPGRVMAESHLKTALVTQCRSWLNQSAELEDVSRTVLRVLANGYEDHPDFYNGWHFDPLSNMAVSDVVWLRFRKLPLGRRWRREARHALPRIKPRAFDVGDIVSIREPTGNEWAGIVTFKTADHAGVRPLG
jgi:hypothetical protein